MKKGKEYIAKTFCGLEEVLATELEEIGAHGISKGNRLVRFNGETSVLYKANMHIRTALRILKPLFQFIAKNEDEFYKNIYKYNWSDIFGCEDTFAVDSVVNSKYFNHSKYIALKCKDAVVDQFRKKMNKRPSVDPNNPKIRIHVHIRDSSCTISLDSSGESLHKRGYRREQGKAPLNEVLAAGLIKLTGWSGKVPFIDPMCGSGTFLIEAALLASNIKPCTYRKVYGFMNWRNFDKKLFADLQRKNLRENISVPIIGSDISNTALKDCYINISEAGLNNEIKIKNLPIEQFLPPRGEGVILVNPPYGERLKDEKIYHLYKQIGDTLKQNCTGYDSWIISPNSKAIKHIGLHASKTITIYNGPLKCKFLKYEIYKGSKKTKLK